MARELVLHGRYTPVDYFQFKAGRTYRFLRAVAGILTWPLVLPAALLSRLSDEVFRTFSELFAVVPFLIGFVVRYEFYRFALTSCGRNVLIDFGVLFLYRQVSIGHDVYLAGNTMVHHCDIGSYVLVSEGCSLLSGSCYHSFERVDMPIAMQGGYKTRIRIEDDCWIGARSVVMADVGTGSVVGSGSVVTKRVEPFSIVAGNPARLMRRRAQHCGEQSADQTECDK